MFNIELRVGLLLIFTFKHNSYRDPCGQDKICMRFDDKIFPSCILQHKIIIAYFLFLNTDLSGTRGGTRGGALDPASDGRGGRGGG